MKAKPCIACGVPAQPDDRIVTDGLTLHRWCASALAIEIIRALRRELGLFRRPKVRA
jgi:hypothetical protein